MLHICSIGLFADDNNIRFNQAKSHCLHICKFNTAIKQYPVELQGAALTWTDHIAHLGHILCSSLDDSMDIDKRKRDFCSQANYFFAHFHHLSPALKSGLFQTYCNHFMVPKYGIFRTLLLSLLMLHGVSYSKALGSTISHSLQSATSSYVWKKFCKYPSFTFYHFRL